MELKWVKIWHFADNSPLLTRVDETSQPPSPCAAGCGHVTAKRRLSRVHEPRRVCPSRSAQVRLFLCTRSWTGCFASFSSFAFVLKVTWRPRCSWCARVRTHDSSRYASCSDLSCLGSSNPWSRDVSTPPPAPHPWYIVDVQWVCVYCMTGEVNKCTGHRPLRQPHTDGQFIGLPFKMLTCFANVGG